VNPLRALFEELAKRRRAFLWLGAVLLANGALYAGLTHRLANKQERLARELDELKGELAAKQEELLAISGAEALAARNADAVRSFWTDVVKERVPGLTDAWDEIDRLASETSVLRGRTGYEREILDVGLEQIRASMPVEGDYFDLVRFINRLERSERFFLVEQIRIAQAATEDAAIQLDCSIAFYLRAAPAGAGP
jgi:hypothetical protein